MDIFAGIDVGSLSTDCVLINEQEEILSYRITETGANSTEAAEISCHALGACKLFPDTRTVVDIGGQDSKVIQVGPGGKVLDFTMNDKCAAGTGRFLEVMAAKLKVPLNDMGSLSMGAKG